MANIPFRAFTGLMLIAFTTVAFGADVSGRVELPELCSPWVSPAVVRLEPTTRAATPRDRAAAEVHFIDQKGLRFEPRIVALSRGDTLRFGNADSELHNVHIRVKGDNGFSRNVVPGATVDFIPPESGVFKVFCDVHDHMRAFVVVGESPWVAACSRAGTFSFRDVPEGDYRLFVWNEMSEPLEKSVSVRGATVDLGTLSPKLGPNSVTLEDRDQTCKTGCEPWPLVIDRIGVTLASSLDAAQRGDSSDRAVMLAQDAYRRDLESSGMKTAVRVHLGAERASEIDDLFRRIAVSTREVVDNKAGLTAVLPSSRQALLQLSRAAGELNRKGVTERSKIFAQTSPAFWVADTPGGESREASGTSEPSLRSWGLAMALLVAIMLAFLFVLGKKGAPVPKLRWIVPLVALAVLVTVLIAVNRRPASSVATEARKATAKPMPDPVPSDAPPPRLHPIGLGVERNHLRIAPVWHRALVEAGQGPRSGHDIDLAVEIEATEGNPHGFAKGEWVPYLTVRYRIEPSAGGKDVSGTLHARMSASGPSYAGKVAMPGPGNYRLTLTIEPPFLEALARVTDPAVGVAPWWEPFRQGFDWTYAPE